MGASITLAGESLIAQKHVAQEGLDVTRFIFANVPGLDHSGPVDRAAAKPPAGQIVFSADIPDENAGYVNPNQVVYSLQVGSDVGDWDFNWIGLETAEGVLFAVSYVPLQQKRRNIPPLQIGNNLTRNFLVAFDGAQALTGITIDASTWQHDFTVRLAGIDERERLSNREIFGRACFFGSSLQLEKVGAAYQLKLGIAYVEGVRLQRSAVLPVVPPAFPTTAWLDVALQRELNDVVASWSVVWGAGKVDYVDSAGVQHYCVSIADLPNSNTITDSRPVENIAGPLVAHFQPKDQTLTELAALATSADKLIYATGSDQFSTATLTAKARTLLASADETTMRAFLGLPYQSTETDPTPGAVLRNGSWGWGDTQPPNIGNLDTYNLPTGVYRFNNGVDTGTTPTGGAWNGVVLHECFSSVIARQTAWEVTGSAADTPKMYVRHLNNNLVGAWREVITSERTTPFSLQLLDDPDAPTMRNSLGLTAAAIATIVSGAIDTGAGRLLTTGYCGLGGVLIATDMDTVSAQPTGFYSTASGTGLIFTPPSGLDVNGVIWNQVRAAAGASAQASQLWVHQSTGRMFRRSAFANAWTAWKEDWNSANLTPAELSPPGAVVHFARNTAPSGWLKANGAAVSRTTYAALFAAIGTTFGAGNGSTTFGLPDLRGEFLRGWDDGRGVDSGRTFGSAQTDDLKSHSHTQGNYYELGSGISGSRYEAALGTNDAALIQTGSYGGIETRPRNIALLACIKY